MCLYFVNLPIKKAVRIEVGFVSLGRVIDINPLIFFFFWIGNEKNFIKKKLANPSTLGMYCESKNQEPKVQ